MVANNPILSVDASDSSFLLSSLLRFGNDVLCLRDLLFARSTLLRAFNLIL